MARLVGGDQAPNATIMTVPDGQVNVLELAAATTRGLVVYFYPRANTPGCTTQACDFRDSLASLKGAGYDVLGVSPDSIERLQGFADKQGLEFRLGSDPDHDMMEAWGAWGEKMLYGRTSLGVVRSTVVVNPDGTVALALYNVRAKGHVARLRRELGIDDTAH